MYAIRSYYGRPLLSGAAPHRAARRGALSARHVITSYSIHYTKLYEANDNGRWEKVPQLGRVRVGDDVEIGANTTIDRGALEDTVLHDGVKLDNLIQIAHNVEIGEHTA